MCPSVIIVYYRKCVQNNNEQMGQNFVQLKAETESCCFGLKNVRL